MGKYFNKNKYNFKISNYNRGMTLVELLVVLAIFIIVTGLTIFDYKSFRSNISIQNLASDISLSIRKAQSYAIGARVMGNSFSNGYGVHFTSSPIPYFASGSNKSFVIFADGYISGIPDKVYNYSVGDIVCGTSNECSEILNITTADKIKDIYLNDNDTLFPPVPISPNSSLDVSFLRPNPDALFCYRLIAADTSCSNAVTITHIKIKISNNLIGSDERIKTITIWNTGQISVK